MIFIFIFYLIVSKSYSANLCFGNTVQTVRIAFSWPTGRCKNILLAFDAIADELNCGMLINSKESKITITFLKRNWKSYLFYGSASVWKN